jgi:hypothetical protein
MPEAEARVEFRLDGTGVATFDLRSDEAPRPVEIAIDSAQFLQIELRAGPGTAAVRVSFLAPWLE